MRITPMSRSTAFVITTGSGHSSTRETALRVAARAIKSTYMKNSGVTVHTCLTQMGDIKCDIRDWALAEQNPFFCPDERQLDALDELLRGLKKRRFHRCKVTVVAEKTSRQVWVNRSLIVWMDLAHALMSINAVKGVEIRDGFGVG